MNLSEKIQDQFDTNSDLRVLFFFDKDKDYVEEIKSVELSDIEIINAERSHFSLKVKLETESKDQKIVLYFPYDQPNSMKAKKNFILLDLLFANQELILDEVTDFMNDFKLLSEHRHIVHMYEKELKLKKHQKVLAKVLNPYEFNESNVIKGLISSYLEFNSIKDSTYCLAKLFILTLPENEQKFAQLEKKLNRSEFVEIISRWLLEYFEISSDTFNKEVIIKASRKLKYNLLTQHIIEANSNDTYSKLRFKEGFTLQRINTLMVDWENEPKLKDEINKVFSVIGKPIEEGNLVAVYGIDSGYSYFTNALKYLLLAETINSVEAKPDIVQNLLQNISNTSDDEKELSSLIKFIGSISNYYNIRNQIKSFRLDTPEEYINSYVDSFSKIDSYYRHTVMAWISLQSLTLPEIIDINQLMNKIHTNYDNYLIMLNREWLDCMKENQFKFNEINVPKQVNFYKDQLIDSSSKVAVIISDALRYECADELLKEMLVDTKGDAKISYMMTNLPSVTHWGMASLLSNKELEFDGDKLKIEGQSVEGTENRQKILKMNDESAVAVQYKILNKMDRDKARVEYFNQRNLIYIYHNTIDAIGDDKKTELNTFSAVNTAILELKNLITKVHSQFAVGRVLITSDHGFLFNYNDLPSASFQTAPKGEHAKSHNRYILTNDTSKVTNSYEMNLSDCSNVSSDLKLLTPKAINRYKRQGSGAHFVHGGASLQEMIIPLIESTRKRVDIGKKVPFRILDTDLKIVSGAIKVRLFQEESVSSTHKSREITVGIYTGKNDLASTEINHIMDSPSDIATDRTKEFILNINSESVQESVLSLKIFDKEDKDKLNPIINQKVINNTFMEMDF